MYFPDKIIMLLEADSITSRMNGIAECDLQDANIPCSIDWKKSAGGDFNNRVRTDALITVPMSDSNMNAFMLGAEFIIERFKKIAWAVVDVDPQEGVFGGAKLMVLRCTRKPAQLPATGAPAVRRNEAVKKAKTNRPGIPYGPGTGPGIMG